jgi:hypothetical protein
MFVMIRSIVHDEQGFRLLMAMLLLVVVVSAIYLWRVLPLMKPFADEVQDAGDALIVRKSDDHIRIPFANIASIDVRFFPSTRGNMYYLITLRMPCNLGSEVAFFPINNDSKFFGWKPWQSPIYDDLTERISQARKIE